MATVKKLPVKKAAKKKQHGGKRPGGGRKRTMIYPVELGKLKPVAFQIPTKKVDEIKTMVREKLSTYRENK